MEMVVMASESIGFKSMEDTGLNLSLMFKKKADFLQDRGSDLKGQVTRNGS